MRTPEGNDVPSTSTRHLARVLCGLTISAATLPMLSGAALAATSGQVVGLQGAWFWADQTAGTSAAGTPVPGTPTQASGVTTGEGDLAVAYKGQADNAPDKMATLAMDLIDVPAGARIDTFTISLAYSPNQRQLVAGGGAAPLVACFVDDGWAEAEGARIEKSAPGYDCAEPVVPTFDAATSTYTFDVTAYAQTWADTGFNNGIALVPAAGATPFQVVFNPASKAVGTVSYEEPPAPEPVPGAPAPEPTQASSGGDLRRRQRRWHRGQRHRRRLQRRHRLPDVRQRLHRLRLWQHRPPAAGEPRRRAARDGADRRPAGRPAGRAGGRPRRRPRPQPGPGADGGLLAGRARRRRGSRGHQPLPRVRRGAGPQRQPDRHHLRGHGDRAGPCPAGPPAAVPPLTPSTC